MCQNGFMFSVQQLHRGRRCACAPRRRRRRIEYAELGGAERAAQSRSSGSSAACVAKDTWEWAEQNALRTRVRASSSF